METRVVQRPITGLLTFLVLCSCFVTIKAVYNETKFMQMALDPSANSNDDAIYLTAQELAVRSGYEYNNYYYTAHDGYTTQIMQLVNPDIDPSELRGTVILYHGANIDMTCYMIASSIQHFPERFPAVNSDGRRSSNRSLAFMLANRFWDVWLVGQRGSNSQNMGHTRNAAGELVIHDDGADTNLTAGEKAYERRRTPFYYQYGLDDIPSFEIKGQIDTIRNITGRRNYALFSYSLSTPTTIAFLNQHPDYARDCVVYFQMAPAIAASHFTFFDKNYFENLCPYFLTVGVGFTPTYGVKTAVRNLVIQTSRSKAFTYSFIKEVTVQLFGPSPKYLTFLERNSLGHVFMPVSFKSVQQYCQNSVSKQFTKFDYGESCNLDVYGTPYPPSYNLSTEAQNYVILSGENDGLAPPETVQRLMRNAKAQNGPINIVAPQFNHYDMIAAFENDIYVNLPVADQLNKYASSFVN